MEKLLFAIEKMHTGEVTRVTVNRLAHDVLIDAANHCGLPNALAMIVLLSKASEVRP